MEHQVNLVGILNNCVKMNLSDATREDELTFPLRIVSDYCFEEATVPEVDVQKQHNRWNNKIKFKKNCLESVYFS